MIDVSQSLVRTHAFDVPKITCVEVKPVWTFVSNLKKHNTRSGTMVCINEGNDDLDGLGSSTIDNIWLHV